MDNDNTDSTILDSDKDEEKTENKEIQKYRRYLPQVSYIHTKITSQVYLMANGLNITDISCSGK